MEDLVTPSTDIDSVDLFRGAYRGRRVLVTGHTGFKGSWLVLWLKELGAQVLGYALAPNTTPSHHELLSLGTKEQLADVRDYECISRQVAEFGPEIVFHLAAQPLVRVSYDNPGETLAINVLGTAVVYDACRLADTVRAIVSITTDKVYKNREWDWGYREVDELGGHDPYSVSKACAELVSASYRDSFWPTRSYGSAHRVLLATARAGNVIGGGDWAKDRLIPDLVRAAATGGKASIRNPASTRPWQHVLDPLLGYLLLGRMLLEGHREFAEAWNFGPAANDIARVAEVVEQCQAAWPALRATHMSDADAPHEAARLALDCAKANARLGWRSVWSSPLAIERTIEWYRSYYVHQRLISSHQLQQFVRDARATNMRGLQ